MRQRHAGWDWGTSDTDLIMGARTTWAVVNDRYVVI
jgi:hypothetical protein